MLSKQLRRGEAGLPRPFQTVDSGLSNNLPSGPWMCSLCRLCTLCLLQCTEPTDPTSDSQSPGRCESAVRVCSRCVGCLSPAGCAPPARHRRTEATLPHVDLPCFVMQRCMLCAHSPPQGAGEMYRVSASRRRNCSQPSWHRAGWLAHTPVSAFAPARATCQWDPPFSFPHRLADVGKRVCLSMTALGSVGLVPRSRTLQPARIHTAALWKACTAGCDLREGRGGGCSHPQAQSIHHSKARPVRDAWWRGARLNRGWQPPPATRPAASQVSSR